MKYLFPQLTYHFLCLETKKVTKENSRKTDPDQSQKRKFSLPGFPGEQSLSGKLKRDAQTACYAKTMHALYFALPLL